METELPPDPEPGSVPLAAESSFAPASAPPVIVPPNAVPPIAVPLIAAEPEFRDRGTGLVIFGSVQIILGLLAALMIPLVALGAFMSRLSPGGAMRPGQFISGVSSYAFIAATFLALGIGSIQMKRWAHALTLITSWYWLFMGALITVLLTAVLPVTMRNALAQAPHNTAGAPPANLSTGVMAVMLTVIIVFAAFFLVVVPIAFVVFYGRKDVAETCRRRDPVERWTDRTPLPVLGASVVLFTGSISLLLTGATTPLFPFFGRYLTGLPGLAGFVVIAALDLYLAAALFRLQSSGWWIALLTVPIRLLSMAITYARADLMQAYSKMGFSDAQLRMLNSSPMIRSHVVLWWSLISLVGLFGYLLWLKRYFKVPSAKQPVEVQTAEAG